MHDKKILHCSTVIIKQGKIIYTVFQKIM